MREHLGRFGERGASVSVFVERGAVWLRFAVGGRTLRRFGDDTARERRKALAYAKRYANARTKGEREGLVVKGRGLTLRELWTRYEKANGPTWRPKTAKGYREYLALVEDYFGAAAKVAAITLDDIDDYREKRRDERFAHSQVRRQIGFLRQLMNFAEGRELLSRNRLRAYRYIVAKEERDQRPDEYSRAELVKIAEQLAAPRHWRARGILTLCGSLGTRINAVLHLTWADVDLDAGVVTWRAAYDKLGEERTQPLTPLARAALVECFGQRHEGEPWVFWAVRAKGKPYHYNSVHHHLAEAEKRAGVEHRPNRAFHGLRRLVVGDMGDLGLAAAWVGQKSLKVTAGYDRERAEKMDEARDRMAQAEAPPERHHQAEGA